MHIHHHLNPQTATLTIHLDPSHQELLRLTHQTPHRQCTLAHRSVRFLLPRTLAEAPDAVHPDLLALVVLLVVHPFVHKELRLSFAVSTVFAAAVEAATGGGVKVFPVDPDIAPRPRPPSPACSVAFNGRIHATLVAAVVGTSARLVAVDHWNAMVGERTSPYPADALYYSLDFMENRGYRVAMVKTDAASLCEPYGFAHPLVACVGNVLLADALGFTSVHVGSRLVDLEAFGTVSRRTRGRGPTETQVGAVPSTLRAVSFKTDGLWVDRPAAEDGAEFLATHALGLPLWRALFHAVSLDLEFPLCGASDACVVKLLHEHRFWKNAHYCLYARPRHKCGTCVECMYYDTLHHAVTHPQSRASLFDRTWRLCADQFPEATAAVVDLKTPNRWHLFWVALVARRDAMPDSGTVPQKHFDVLHAYARVYASHRYGLHGGMVTLLGEHESSRVMEGWKGMFRGVV